MQLRSQNQDTQINSRAREIVGPFIPEVGKLNDEAAVLLATLNRPNLTEADGAAILRRAAEAHAALERIERQLDGSLHGQPSEIAQHGRVHDIRAGITAVRSRLRTLGALDT